MLKEQQRKQEQMGEFFPITLRDAKIQGQNDGLRICGRTVLNVDGLERRMPHVIVKLWPGKSEKQKSELAQRIVQDVMEVLHYGEEAVSVAIEEVAPGDWMDKVYKPDIKAKWDGLYKEPGYEPS